MQSEQIDKITIALATAQGQMKNATFNRINPHFKNKYADLASIIDAVRKPLADNKIGWTQTTARNGGTGFWLVTTLMHAGQWISSEYPLPSVGIKSQEMGSALTYAKRYSLSSICGIAADEDDDAEVAQKAPRRENPNINRPEDFIDKAEYDEEGNPVNNIPRGNPELRPLTKKNADILLDNLRAKMKYATNREALMLWGKSIADEAQTLPDHHQVRLREDFADRLSELP